MWWWWWWWRLGPCGVVSIGADGSDGFFPLVPPFYLKWSAFQWKKRRVHDVFHCASTESFHCLSCISLSAICWAIFSNSTLFLSHCHCCQSIHESMIELFPPSQSAPCTIMSLFFTLFIAVRSLHVLCLSVCVRMFVGFWSICFACVCPHLPVCTVGA